MTPTYVPYSSSINRSSTRTSFFKVSVSVQRTGNSIVDAQSRSPYTASTTAHNDGGNWHYCN